MDGFILSRVDPLLFKSMIVIVVRPNFFIEKIKQEKQNMSEATSVKTNPIKKGDLVRLLNSTIYQASAANPKIGSKHECVGVVTTVYSRDSIVCVKWENGTNNDYSYGDLVVEEGDGSGRYITIWDTPYYDTEDSVTDETLETGWMRFIRSLS